MSKIQVLADRGGANIFQGLFLEIEKKNIEISFENGLSKQYNIRFIFEIAEKELSYPEAILGNKLVEKDLGKIRIDENSRIALKNNQGPIISGLNLDFVSNDYSVGVMIYEDNPVHHYGVLDAVPVPTDIITIYIYFSKDVVKSNDHLHIQKYFDGYSHLGFLLVDLPKMEQMVLKEYGQRELDLVEEFTNTELIDKLFNEEIIMIVWGINPFTYPIYSSKNIDLLKPLLGNEFDQQGIFKIDESIDELSIVPGHELRNWPNLLEKKWPKIKLHGEGKKTYLKPFCLENSEFETIITSFLIYRTEGSIEESKPLINVDLLYS